MSYASVAWLNSNPISINLFRILLQAKGYRVSTFDNAGDALIELSRTPYDIIVLDLDLSPGNTDDDSELEKIAREAAEGSSPEQWRIGLYVIESVRRGPNSNTPVVVLTQYHSTESLVLPNAERVSLEAGATRYYHHHPELSAQNFVSNLIGLSLESVQH